MTAIVNDNEFGFTYAGTHSREFNLRIIDIRRTIFPTMEEQNQNIPGMTGDLYQGMNKRSRNIYVDVKIIADSHEQRVDLSHKIANWLDPISDGEFDLTFDDQTNYTFYAHCQNTTDIARSLYNGLTTITFTCSDPKAYGEQVEIQIKSNPVTIYPHGEAECYPIITCIPKREVSKIAVTDDEGNYTFIGADVDPDTGGVLVNKEPRVWHDNCNTLATWTTVTPDTLTFNLENGVIGGSMKSTPNTLRPSSYGSNVSSKWHGPVVMQWLPGSYSDYRIRVRFLNRQFYPRAQGKIELYLLDSNGARIGKVMLKDNGTNSKVVYAQAQLGWSSTDPKHHEIYYGPGKIHRGSTVKKSVKIKNGTKTTTYKGRKKTVQLWKTVKTDYDKDTSTYTDFYGYIEIKKVGNKYRAEILKMDYDGNPGWTKPLVYNWTDSKNEYKGALAGVALYTAKWDITEDRTSPAINYKENDLALTDLQVWNIIDGGNTTGEPETIAHAGDEIKFNSEDHTVYKNGAYFMDKFYIGSDFLKLQGGIPKSIAVEPGIDEADWYLSYRPTRK